MDNLTEEREKIDAYLQAIDEHVVRPIRETDIKDSCTATILLVFAAIDGLGKLTHRELCADPGQRFRYYLATYMSGSYGRLGKKLYELRNSLAHNAISFTSYMSKTEKGEAYHLKQYTPLGYLFVSSTVLFADFCSSLEKLKTALDRDAELVARAGSRLEWLEEYPDSPRNATAPGPIEFVSLKG